MSVTKCLNFYFKHVSDVTLHRKHSVVVLCYNSSEITPWFIYPVITHDFITNLNERLKIHTNVILRNLSLYIWDITTITKGTCIIDDAKPHRSLIEVYMNAYWRVYECSLKGTTYHDYPSFSEGYINAHWNAICSGRKMTQLFLKWVYLQLIK